MPKKKTEEKKTEEQKTEEKKTEEQKTEEKTEEKKIVTGDVAEDIYKIRGELADIYAQLDRLKQGIDEIAEYMQMIEEIADKVEKIRKMVYWHKKNTEDQGKEYSKGYYKSYRNSSYYKDKDKGGRK